MEEGATPCTDTWLARGGPGSVPNQKQAAVVGLMPLDAYGTRSRGHSPHWLFAKRGRHDERVGSRPPGAAARPRCSRSRGRRPRTHRSAAWPRGPSAGRPMHHRQAGRWRWHRRRRQRPRRAPTCVVTCSRPRRRRGLRGRRAARAPIASLGSRRPRLSCRASAPRRWRRQRGVASSLDGPPPTLGWRVLRAGIARKLGVGGCPATRGASHTKVASLCHDETGQ